MGVTKAARLMEAGQWRKGGDWLRESDGSGVREIGGKVWRQKRRGRREKYNIGKGGDQAVQTRQNRWKNEKDERERMEKNWRGGRRWRRWRRWLAKREMRKGEGGGGAAAGRESRRMSPQLGWRIRRAWNREKELTRRAAKRAPARTNKPPVWQRR